MIYKISCTTGESFDIDLPEPAEMGSFFAFSLHKAGSTLMFAMLEEYCYQVGVPTINPFGTAWLNGIRSNSIDMSIEDIFKTKGYGYLGFRFFFTFESSFDFSLVRKVLLVRDPRDILTSLYFSVSYSHPKPKIEGDVSKYLEETRNLALKMDINQFVLERADAIRAKFERYSSALTSENLRIYRYEDVIFQKADWLSDIISYFELPVHMDLIRAIADKNDIRPEKEDPTMHIRQVAPGNYKKHLSDRTTELLNEIFFSILDRYNYSGWS